MVFGGKQPHAEQFGGVGHLPAPFLYYRSGELWVSQFIFLEYYCGATEEKLSPLVYRKKHGRLDYAPCIDNGY